MMTLTQPDLRLSLIAATTFCGTLAAAPLFAGTGTPSGFTAAAQQEHAGDEGEAMTHVRAELGLDRQVVASGSAATLGVRFQIEETWHLYWRNSGDSGMPISVTFEAPEGVTIGEVQWPAPQRYVYGHGSVDYIYEQEVALLADIQLDDRFTAGDEVAITARFDLLACKEACVFGMGERSIVIRIDEDDVGDEPGWMKKSRARIPSDDQSPLDLRWDGNDLLISGYKSDRAGRISFFPYGPLAALPTNPLDDGTSETGRLRITYPKDITEAPLVAGVVEIMGREGPVWIEIETTPPGSAKRGGANEPTNQPTDSQSTNHRSGD